MKLQSDSLSNLIKKSTLKSILIFGLICISTAYSLVLSQPSGGPYGPVPQSYEIPDVPGKIIYVAPEGLADNNGKSIKNPTSIEQAVKLAKTGDAIILRGGIYRTGDLITNQGIILQPYEDEQPVLKGTYVAEDWKALGSDLWVTTWEKFFPMAPQSWWRWNRHAKWTPLHRFNNDMVFANGRFLQSASWPGEVDENSYYIHYETGEVFIGVDPTENLIEITAFNVGLHRVTTEVNNMKPDNKGPKLKGIKFTQYAYRAIEVDGTEPEGLSNEKDHGKQVVGTLLDNCEISYCSRVAGYFRGDSLVIKQCKISNTSTEGIYIIASSDVLLERNIFTKNNIEKITGYYPAAVKIFNQSYRVTCNDNLVIDHPNSNGIWYDVGNVDGVFTNNWIQNVGHTDFNINTNHLWPSDNGFFFEISKGAICAGNVFVNCDHGIMVLNSSDVKMYNNTFYNSMATVGRDTRSAQGDHFGWHPSTGPDVDERVGHVFVNNLMVGDEHFNRPLFFAWQKAELCGKLTNPQFEQMDNNLYSKSLEVNNQTLLIYGPTEGEDCQQQFTSLEDMQKATKFDQNSSFVPLSKAKLLKSPITGNFESTLQVQELQIPAILPEKVQLMLEVKGKPAYIGAYPVKK